jgi:hypothetical protein
MCIRDRYGDTTKRPHYHLIIFGYAFLDDRKPYKKSTDGSQLYWSEILDRIWGKGFCVIGNVTPETAGYVARYSMKKITGERAEQHYQRKTLNIETGEIETTHLQPEFMTCSNRPGIGHSYYIKYGEQLAAHDNIAVKGQLRPVPKYYDRLLEKDDHERLKTIKKKRVKRAKTKQNKLNSTHERLAVREFVKQQKIRTLARIL